MSRSYSFRRRSALHVENLESRQLLSGVAMLPIPGITVQQIGSVLTINGTPHADQIQINDHGSFVRVFTDGEARGNFSGVNTINVNAGAGNDTVTFNALGTDPSNIGGAQNVSINKNLNVNLGAGNDSFQENVFAFSPLPGVTPPLSSLGANSNLNALVNGGTGNDSASFHANVIGVNSNVNLDFNGGAGNDLFLAAYGLPVAAQQADANVKLTFLGGAGNDRGVVDVVGDLPSNSQTAINMLGGAGNDQLFVNYVDGIMDGNVNLLLDGGDGNDKIFADFEMRAGSNLGTLNASEFGDAGNDTMSLIVHDANPGDTTTVDGLMTGGNGNDSATFTSNIETVTGFETLNPVA